MLTLLSSFSQEESRFISENVKWGIRKRFEQGIPNSFCIYGYRWNGEKFVIVPEEAKSAGSSTITSCTENLPIRQTSNSPKWV